MSNVIEFRRPERPEAKTRLTTLRPMLAEPNKITVDRSAMYECTRCGSISFQITHKGLVVCEECDALMKNLHVEKQVPA